MKEIHAITLTCIRHWIQLKFLQIKVMLILSQFCISIAVAIAFTLDLFSIRVTTSAFIVVVDKQEREKFWIKRINLLLSLLRSARKISKKGEKY